MRLYSMKVKICIFYFIIGFLGVPNLSLTAQSTWDMVKSDGDIFVYTRKTSKKGFKEIKIEAQIRTSLNTLMAAFNDVEAHKEWVYKTPESKLVKLDRDNAIHYYVRLDFPFPAQDRDLLIHYKWEQDPSTKIITTRSTASKVLVPIKEDVIRVDEFYSEYVLTPLPDGMIKIDYSAKMDPGGKLPIWLVNMGVTIGPTKSMKSLFDLINSGRYDEIKVEGIKELTRS